MRKEILALLRERKGEYVSGQELCQCFGVSRTAVWKAVNRLKEDGYEIESVSRKGYRLLASPDILSEEEVLSRMETCWAGRQVHYLDEVDSTNTECRRIAEKGAAHGTLVVAEMQTAGKGRRGRSWQQEPGTMISMSLLLRPVGIAPERASMLTLPAAYAVAGAIRELCGLEAGIKWPNDVVVGKKKVCGILTEMSLEMDEIRYILVGIGINANVQLFSEEISQIATSLYLESGERVVRSQMMALVMKRFEADYEAFLKAGDLRDIREEYNRLLVNRDARVKVLDPKGEYEGVARGIDEMGQLLVECGDGRLEKVYAGEVSVRGIYGYV